MVSMVLNMNMQSEQINELAVALAKSQAVLKNPGLDASNPYFKSRYCSLANLIASCKPLAEHGLSFTQVMTVIGDKLFLATTLMHASGQWIRSFNPIISKDQSNPQAVGSAITYARRYGLQAIVGLVGDDDDDGNEAAKAPAKPATLSNEQIVEIQEMASKEEIDKIIGRMKNYGCVKLSEVPADQFENFKKAIIQMRRS